MRSGGQFVDWYSDCRDVRGLEMAESNLLSALNSLLGQRGEYWSYRDLAGPEPTQTAGPAPTVAPSVPSEQTVARTLQAAASAGSEGVLWSPG